MRLPSIWRRTRERFRDLLNRDYASDEGRGTHPADGWQLTRSGSDRTRWRRDAEVLDCFQFGGGYVVTVGYSGIRNRWQTTPGYVPLGSALAVANLYLDYRLSPQVDRSGRPFVGVAGGAPRQVFTADDADEADVEYVYLDTVHTLEDFPDFLDVRSDVRRAYSRMTAPRPTSVGD
ncbi:MAG: hypothetical protein ABEH47_09250 [Haloferacaceae archaeon]